MKVITMSIRTRGEEIVSNMANANITPKSKFDLVYLIHCVIGLLLMFGFGNLPPITPVTPLGMKVLGIFIGCIYMWSFISCLWPSILGFIALGISGYAPFKTVLLNSFGDTTVQLVLFAMILFGGIEHSGATKYVSRWFLTRKIINGRPCVFSFVLIYTGYVISALGSTLPALLFIWSVLYSLFEDVGYKKGDKYVSIMMIGGLVGAFSGQFFKPFAGSPLMMIAAFEKVSGLKIDYLSYMSFNIIMQTLAIIVFCLLIKFVFKPDMSKIANISVDRFKKDKLPPMTIVQKIYFFCLFGFMALVIIPSALPQSIGIVAVLNQIGAHGVAMLLVVVLCAIKIDGKPVMNFKEIVGKYVAWDVYLLVAMAMVISTALTENSTGIKPFLINVLNPILGGQSSLIFSAIIMLFCICITQVANNAVMGVLLAPIMVAFAGKNGTNSIALMTLMVATLHIAIVTPAASPFAAVIHGNKDWITSGEVSRYGIILVIAFILLYWIVGIPLANLLF